MVTRAQLHVSLTVGWVWNIACQHTQRTRIGSVLEQRDEERIYIKERESYRRIEKIT